MKQFPQPSSAPRTPDAATDVVIVGAGPYGLSLAAHLRSRGVDFRIFGPPMQAWLDMSPGMYLKSFDFAVSVWAPEPGTRFVEWCRDRGIDSREPTEIALFARYGLWAQQHLVPELERSMVTGITGHDNRFVNNTLVSGYEGAQIPVWLLSPAGNTYAGGSPCTLDTGEVRLHTGGNVIE